jgi:hypothetical protein
MLAKILVNRNMTITEASFNSKKKKKTSCMREESSPSNMFCRALHFISESKLVIIKITNFLDIIHHLDIIKTLQFGDWSLSEDGDRLQSLKCHVLIILRRWIMSSLF